MSKREVGEEHPDQPPVLLAGVVGDQQVLDDFDALEVLR
jgi:hypothetical protein